MPHGPVAPLTTDARELVTGACSYGREIRVPAPFDPQCRYVGRARGPLNGASEAVLRRDGEHASWPHASFRWVPEAPQALRLAAEVRRKVWGIGPMDPVPDLSLLLAAGDFDLSEANLAVNRGGHEALMFPGQDGRLHIRVDPRPKTAWGTDSAELRRETCRHRLRFRVAHEVAHSFFYERDPRGARRRRGGSPAEERFCDLFASGLLVPPEAARATAPTAPSVLTLHQHFDVSVEAAARALAEAHSDLDVVLGYWNEHEPQPAPNLHLQWASEGMAESAETALRAAGDAKRQRWMQLTTARPPAPRRQLVAVGRYDRGDAPAAAS